MSGLLEQLRVLTIHLEAWFLSETCVMATYKQTNYNNTQTHAFEWVLFFFFLFFFFLFFMSSWQPDLLVLLLVGLVQPWPWSAGRSQCLAEWLARGLQTRTLPAHRRSMSAGAARRACEAAGQCQDHAAAVAGSQSYGVPRQVSNSNHQKQLSSLLASQFLLASVTTGASGGDASAWA